MAPATSTAAASSRSRRLRLALLLAISLAPAAAHGGPKDGPVYIWRDANGVVRFSVPAPPR